MQSFVVESLAASSVLEAWPLVHLAIPGLELAAWRQAARAKPRVARSNPRSGILVARGIIRRPICGMVWYRVEVDLACGRVLRARHLFAIDLIDPLPILTALLNRLGPVAQALNCATIRLAADEAGPARLLPSHAVLPLKLHLRLERWLDISFSADRLSRNDAESQL